MRGFEFDDGVEDELAGVVGGCAAAAADGEEFDAGGEDGGFVGFELVFGFAGAEGDDGRMFDDEDGIGDGVGLAVGAELHLQREGLGVGDEAAVADGQRNSICLNLLHKSDSIPESPLKINLQGYRIAQNRTEMKSCVHPYIVDTIIGRGRPVCLP